MSQNFSTFKTCAIAIPDSQKTDAPSVEADIGGIGGTPFSTVSRAVLTKLDELWSNGQSISYSFFGGTPKQQKKVDTVIPEWSQYANITFERVSDAAADAAVRITFDPQSGSWSYVGTVVKTIVNPRITMNLGWIDDSDGLSPDEHGVIMHEWGHTLGLMHEHQSPARGGKLHLNEDAVYAYYMATQKWDRATVKSQIIDVYNATAVSNYSELDLTSVMMYFMPAAMNLEHIDVPVNNQLSPLDKAYMVINYPRPQPHPLAPQWTLDFALKVAGVDDATAAAIKNAPDVDKARMAFTSYAVAQRRKNVANAVKTPGSPDAGPSNNDPSHGTTVAPTGTTRDTWCGATALKAAMGPSDAQHGLARPGIFWPPNSTVKYGFMHNTLPDQATAYRVKRVRDVLDVYESVTSLKFQLVDILGWNFDLAQNRDLCPVRICFGPSITQKDGSITYGWSYEGTDALTVAYDPAVLPLGGEKWTTAYLGAQPAADWSTDVDISRADHTLWHELGHMMGLAHEHASPNSPVGVPGNVADYLVSTLFDAQSVMLYADIPYNNDPSRVTVLSVQPSVTDKYLLSLLYPDSGDANSKFALALNAFGFTATKKELLLTNAKDALATGANASLMKNLREAIAFDIVNNPRLAETPSHGVGQPQKGADPVPAAGQGTKMPGFLMELVDALKQFFNPGGNQIFTLQFPGRFLQQTDYAWDTATAGFYGQFVKPVAVNEAEFRLVDQLYDLTDRVGGPNGLNLSIVYEQLLNNFLPKFVDNGLPQQQDQIREWLLKDTGPVSPWVAGIMSRQQQREKDLANSLALSMGRPPPVPAAPTTSSGTAPLSAVLIPGMMHDISSKGTGDTLNRIELSQLLTNEYLYAKQDWEEERDSLIRQASQPKLGTPESRQALNDLTRKLAHITATRQAQLAAKYSDAVVRGYSHAVRDYMGYLDISSPAEALQSAKDSLRESAASSLDGALKVYPIQLTPLDWFDSLSTSFNLEDLTADPEVIRTQINAKSQQVDTLNAQLIALQMDATGDPTALQQKVDAAQTELDAAQSTLAETYSNNVISMARTYLDATGKLDPAALAAKTGVAPALLAQLPDQMEKVRVAQDKLTASSRALSQLLAAHALAVATDTQQQQQQLQLQIKSITKDLNELQTRWQILTASSGGVTPAQLAKTDTIPLNPTDAVALPDERSSGGSRWQTISFQSSKSSRTATTSASSTASSEQWSCNFWLASGSGSSSSSSSTSTAATTASEDTIDVAFRATLVTVDRSGWFQPQFFKESKAFYKVNSEISWVDGAAGSGVKGLLPGFPIAFLIVKDVVIRVTHASTSTDDMKHFDSSSSSSSGGCLCFSYSRSNSSSNTATSSSFQAFSNGFVVKIPGPQILGYMIQKTDPDESLLMPSTLPGNFFTPGVQPSSALKAVDPNSSDSAKPGQSSTATPAPANAAAPAPPDSAWPTTKGAAPASGSSSAAKPVIAVDKVREIVGHIVEERLDELFTKITAQV